VYDIVAMNVKVWVVRFCTTTLLADVNFLLDSQGFSRVTLKTIDTRIRTAT
jgi:hypothetical protein